MRQHDVQQFQQNIGYEYRNRNLMLEALTHPSSGKDGKSIKHNQRLEFLGDSVLSIIVSQHLFEHYTDLLEGQLTKLRASLVCEKSLHEFAKQISLGQFLILGNGEELTGGRARPSILADAFEAVLGSIYLDGGLEPARQFVLRFIPKNMMLKDMSKSSDYKTTLQEIIQKNPEEKVEYVTVEEKGPDHDKIFTVEVHLNSNVIGVGEGKSKKQAEQCAAKEALKLMGSES